MIKSGKIESEIKSLEKDFSRQDIKDFEEKYNKEFEEKQYDLESARVFESALNQIELKRQKFNNVSQKMINEYGKKYEEIKNDDVSNDVRKLLFDNLLDETRTYDEKNRHSISRLNSEQENLIQNFQGKVQDVNTIYSQMQNLHLLDKSRYLEDMMSSVNPKLADLYRKRYLLNSYRLLHGEPVYDKNANSISNVFKNLLNKIRNGNTKLAIRTTF